MTYSARTVRRVYAFALTLAAASLLASALLVGSTLPGHVGCEQHKTYHTPTGTVALGCTSWVYVR